MSLEDHEAIIYDLRAALVSILRVVNTPGLPVTQLRAVRTIAKGAALNVIDEMQRLKGKR